MLYSATIGLAQNMMTVTSTSIADASGVPLANGVACFKATDNTGAPISFKAPAGGQAMIRPVCAPVTAGAFSVSLPNVALTNRANVCFALTVTDRATGQTVLKAGDECLQPSPTAYWCSGSTCNLDNFIPAGATNTQVIAGPAGPPNSLSIGTVTTGAAGSTAAATITGTAPTQVLNLAIPQGASGSGGSGGSSPQRYTLNESIDGVRTTFTLTGTPSDTQHFAFYWNGLAISPVNDFSLAGNTLTLARPPKPGDLLFAMF
jgi:hypothetical protein